MILRLLLKIKSYVHSPHSLLHNGLPCVQSLPPCLRPNKPSIYLCHVLFALWQWTIHRVKGTRKGWGRGPDTSSVLQPLCQERPKQEMEQRKFTQGRGERTEKRRTQRKWPSSGPLLWELILRISFLRRGRQTTTWDLAKGNEQGGYRKVGQDSWLGHKDYVVLPNLLGLSTWLCGTLKPG